MIDRRLRPALVTVLLLLAATAAASAADAPDTAPLATINGDPLTLDDLDVELFLMKSQQGKGPVLLPAAGDVLQRLIQNTLLFQEGQRLGLDRDGMILNQVNENVRHRSVIALVDSVAFTVPEDTPDRRDRQFEAIDDYVASLMKTYDVQVDSTLLRSLDYGSADPEMQAYLRNSEDVLCKSPTGNMKVRSLTKTIMLQEFHGLVGKPDAAGIRDKHFDEWVTEAVLTYAAGRQGIPDSPSMRMLARYQTRDLVLQETLGVLAKIRFEPSEQELRDFYAANIEHVTPPGRVKVESIMLQNEEAARLFKSRLDQGAEMKWLANRTSEIIENMSAIPTTWLMPAMIGLAPGEARVGLILEPMEVPGGWVVAAIREMEETRPTPFEECRSELLRRMRAERTENAIVDAVKLLEHNARIEIAPGAEERIAAHLVEWKRKNDV